MIKQENPLLFSPSKSTVIIKVAFDPPFPISYRTFELDLKQTGFFFFFN